MAVRFKLRRGFDLARDTTRGRLLLEEITHAVAARAQTLAPVDEGFLEGGIRGEVIEEQGKTIGRVTSYDFKGAWWEFGWSSRPAGRPYLAPAAAEIVGNVE